MACNGILDQISAHLDGELSPEEEVELAEHLERCPQCRQLARELEQVHALLSGAALVRAPEQLHRRLVESVERDAASAPRRSRRALVRRVAGLAACAAVCLGVWRLALPPQDAGTVYFAAPASQSDVTGETPALGGPEDEKDARVYSAYAYTASSESNSTADAYGSEAASAKDNRSKNAETPAAPSHYAFANQQTVRLAWTEELYAPASARILGSVQSLETFAEQFPGDGLEEVLAPYDAAYFTQNRLLAVVVTEGSGSISHSIRFQGLYRDEVEITRTVPEVGTCDMAAWLLLAEVDATFHDGDTLDVVLVED